ncbi:MAG: hypothetical protein P8Y67_08275 [Alphaproteobacteria bacterium]
MRWLLGAGAAAVIFFPLVANAGSASKCDRAAFVAVVSEASAQLSAINTANKKSFEMKLRALKARQNWTDRDFVAKATPFVKDKKIAAFDAFNKALLTKVSQLGKGASNNVSLASLAGGGDSQTNKKCQMLNKLRGIMANVVENTRTKWAYMLGKIDAANSSEPTLQASAGQ